MHPILVTIGDFAIHTYGALSALGFLIVVFMAIRRAKAIGVQTEHLVDVIFWSAMAGVVGARGLWVFQNFEHAPTFGDWINLRQGGLVFYGAILAGVPMGIGVMKWRKLPILGVADIFALLLPIGHGISRLGCYAAGCCYGTESSLPWAVTFSHPLTDAPHDVGLHPTQLYEALTLFAISGVLHLMYSKKRFDGQILLGYLGLYAVARFVLEFVRGDLTRGSFAGTPLSLSQGVALCIFAAVLAAGAVLVRKKAA